MSAPPSGSAPTSGNAPLAGRVALVTGGASGIGLATALLLAERGARVAITDVREDGLDAAAAHARADGLDLMTLRADSRLVAEVEAAVACVEREAGRLDVLVNNAGISGRSLPIDQVDEAAFDAMMDVHVKGAFFATRAAVPGMRARGFGRIVQIASHFAMIGHPSMSHYVGAKAALLGLTKAWAREFAPDGITVNAVAPALIDTPMTQASLGGDEIGRRAAMAPLGRLAVPREIAYAVAWLASDEAATMTGQVVSPNGGMAIVGI